MTDFETQVHEYRHTLLQMEQQMQTVYDKAVMTLSGGALGVSFTFLKDVADKATLHDTGWLIGAWIMWGVSVTCTLFSFLTSTVALRHAVRQTDLKTIYLTAVGGPYDKVTAFLNALAGILFLGGVIAISVFVGGNMP
jgi:hypothetical protein